MEINKYFVTSEEDKKSVRSLFGVSDKEVEEKINTLTNWIKTQPHLPLESANESFLDLMLLREKFKEEVVKKNIDNYYKIICRYPEYFCDLSKLKPSGEVGAVFTTIKPTTSFERIGIIKLFPEKILTNNLDVNRCIIYALATALIVYNIDYTAGLRIIMDFTGFTLSDVLKININDLFKAMNIHENALKLRISGIEVINAPDIISAILKIAKLVLKPKLFNRITVHEDLTSLHENVPKSCLPVEYGGEEENVDELVNMWDEIFENRKEFFERIDEMVKLERKKEDKNDLFGVQGSFKSLIID